MQFFLLVSELLTYNRESGTPAVDTVRLAAPGTGLFNFGRLPHSLSYSYFSTCSDVFFQVFGASATVIIERLNELGV